MNKLHLIERTYLLASPLLRPIIGFGVYMVFGFLFLVYLKPYSEMKLVMMFHLWTYISFDLFISYSCICLLWGVTVMALTIQAASFKLRDLPCHESNVNKLCRFMLKSKARFCSVWLVFLFVAPLTIMVVLFLLNGNIFDGASNRDMYQVWLKNKQSGNIAWMLIVTLGILPIGYGITMIFIFLKGTANLFLLPMQYHLLKIKHGHSH